MMRNITTNRQSRSKRQFNHTSHDLQATSLRKNRLFPEAHNTCHSSNNFYNLFHSHTCLRHIVSCHTWFIVHSNPSYNTYDAISLNDHLARSHMSQCCPQPTSYSDSTETNKRVYLMHVQTPVFICRYNAEQFIRVIQRLFNVSTDWNRIKIKCRY
jgi:hypothetical protein